MQLDDDTLRMQGERDRRLKDLEQKYPKAKTDEFQKACMMWELMEGGRGSWMIECQMRNVQKIMDDFSNLFDPISGFEAGLGLQAFSDKPNGAPVGFKVVCYESAKDMVEAKLRSIRIEESEMSWIPESELRRQFEEWKEQYRK